MYKKERKKSALSYRQNLKFPSVLVNTRVKQNAHVCCLAVAQADSHPLFAAKTQLQSRVISGDIRGGRSGAVSEFSLSSFRHCSVLIKLCKDRLSGSILSYPRS
jgi:hypothetical protein